MSGASDIVEARQWRSGIEEKLVGEMIDGLNDENFRTDCMSQARGYFGRFEDTSGLCTLICDALKRKDSISLIRIGDGEGNVLRLSRYFDEPPTREDLGIFEERFISMNGISFAVSHKQRLDGLDEETSRLKFCNQMADAVADADIIGARAVWADLPTEASLITDCLEAGNVSAGLGLLHARLFVERLLQRKALGKTLITLAHCHLAIMPHLDTLIAHAERVIVISGRPEVMPVLEKLGGHKSLLFLEIPPEGGSPNAIQKDHYAYYFQKTSDNLDTDLKGTLVLVGAGIFGKIYCDIAKNRGAVAIDIGSVFDLMAGLKTRPIHQGDDEWLLGEYQRKGIVPTALSGPFSL